MIEVAALMVTALISAELDPLTHLGSLTEELRSPARVAVMADGTVLVTDLFHDHVARYDANGVLAGVWPVAEGPIGVAAHPDGRFFVSRRDDAKVGIYDAGFNFLGFLGDGIVTFGMPTDIDIDVDTGRIYVADSGADRIVAFESDGSLALIAGQRGSRNGEFKYPSAIRVDESRGLLIVADHDNFRGQMLTTDGIFQKKFGARILYQPGRGGVGWMPRTLGLEVDPDGYIYVADAMMSAVRVFTPTGTDLGRVVSYGYDAGDLRTPGGMALNADGTRLYVVSSNSSSVEIYAAPDFGDGGGGGGNPAPEPDQTLAFNPVAEPLTLTGKLAHAAHAVLIQAGMPPIREPGRRGLTAGFEGPHMIDGNVICGRCHAIDGQPGGHPGLVEGQFVLCASCHTGGGQALADSIHERDVADPYGMNPDAPDHRGVSHAWGVSAVNAMAASIGPKEGGQVNRYLDDNGNIKCATCHDQHSGEVGEPYLRAQNDRDQMCRECHQPRDMGLYRDDPENNRGSHPVDMIYPDDPDRFTPADELAHVRVKNGRVECMSCHALHGADSGGANDGAGDGRLLRTVNDHTLCMECHSGDLAPKSHGTLFPQGCLTCHDPHDNDSNNVFMIRREVEFEDDAVPVAFTDRSTGVGPGAYVDPDPDVKGICEACHAYPSDNPNLEPKHSLDWMPRCTECHLHHAGFDFVEGDLPTQTYVGDGECARCHTGMHENWDETLHAHALTTLENIGQGRNAFCLPCHTVGFGQPTGFVSRELTPNLADVQCENCHGTGSDHVNRALASRITTDYEGELCGTCHVGTHHPTFTEWEASGHPESYINSHSASCTPCHAPTEPGEAHPVRGVECVACHTPHARTGNGHEPPEPKDYQLRWPQVKTVTPSNHAADAINPDRFNLCGQCHHSRGTMWDRLTRGPHHSLQANVLVGEMPVPEGTPDLVPFTSHVHGRMRGQCTRCHMFTKEYVSEEDPAITGHTWAIDFRACGPCHDEQEAEEYTHDLHAEVSAALADIVARMGPVGEWEYQCCGGPPLCGNPPVPPCQELLPTQMIQVRFLMKYVEGDASLGVHNPNYVRLILEKCDELLREIGR